MSGKTISLALSSGGARGLAHIGAIEELESRGYIIGAVSGSSIGAVAGGLFAAGKLQKYRDWMLTLGRKEVFSLLDISLVNPGLFKGERVFNEMEKVVGDCLIEECAIPFTAVATDLFTKRDIWFRKGSLFKALRASVAVPTILNPVMTEGNLLVDGGVGNPLPLDAIAGNKTDLIVAVNINANVPYVCPPGQIEKKTGNNEYWKKLARYLPTMIVDQAVTAPPKRVMPGVINLLNKSIDLMEDRLIELTLHKYHPDIVVNISRDVCGIFDFYKGRDLIEAGRLACRTALDEYEKTLDPKS